MQGGADGNGRWRGLRRRPRCHGHAKRMRVEAALAIVGLPWAMSRASIPHVRYPN
jgi:hypothetical protein